MQLVSLEAVELPRLHGLTLWMALLGDIGPVQVVTRRGCGRAVFGQPLGPLHFRTSSMKNFSPHLASKLTTLPHDRGGFAFSWSNNGELSTYLGTTTACHRIHAVSELHSVS
jgi:hypothetical protein